jgi:hypothetical protein
MLNTVGRCIETKYWGIFYVEHYGKIYLYKILGNNGKLYRLLRASGLNTSSYSVQHSVFHGILFKYIFQ